MSEQATAPAKPRGWNSQQATEASRRTYARKRAQRAIDELVEQGYTVAVTGPGAEHLRCS